jgi:hypothetical protein
VCVELSEELGELIAARDARRAPEVDHHWPTTKRREIELRAVEGRAGDRWRRLVDGGSPVGRLVVWPADAGDEHPDADGREDRDGEGAEDRTTRRDEWPSR